MSRRSARSSSASSSDNPSPESWPLRCGANPSLPAAAFCTVCSQPFSGKFLGVRVDGRAVCFSCARRDEIELIASAEPISEVDPVLSGGWLRAIREVALHPHRTLAKRHDGPIGGAVALGLVATIIGFVGVTGWNLALSDGAYVEATAEGLAQLGVTLDDTTLLWGLWLRIPLVAAVRFAIGAALFHVGVRIMVGADASPSESIRVFALASGPLILCAVPAFGPFIALVTWISACMAFLQVQHGVRTVRGLMAVLPSLLVITAIGPRSFSALT